MTHDSLKWLTGKPERNGRVLAEVKANGKVQLWAANADNGQFRLGNIPLSGHIEIISFTYLDDEAPAVPVSKVAVVNPPVDTPKDSK